MNRVANVVSMLLIACQDSLARTPFLCCGAKAKPMLTTCRSLGCFRAVVSVHLLIVLRFLLYLVDRSLGGGHKTGILPVSKKLLRNHLLLIPVLILGTFNFVFAIYAQELEYAGTVRGNFRE